MSISSERQYLCQRFYIVRPLIINHPNLWGFLRTWNTAHRIVWVCVLSQFPFCPIFDIVRLSINLGPLLYLRRMHISPLSEIPNFCLKKKHEEMFFVNFSLIYLCINFSPQCPSFAVEWSCWVQWYLPLLQKELRKKHFKNSHIVHCMSSWVQWYLR